MGLSGPDLRPLPHLDPVGWLGRPPNGDSVVSRSGPGW